MISRKANSYQSVVVMLAACFLWAVSFIASKTALQAAPPLTVVSLRLLFSALCFLPLLYRCRTNLLLLGRGVWWRLGLLSVFGGGLHYGSQTVGLQYTTASNASLWAMTCPISIALISAFFLGERLTARKIAGITIAVAGILVVMGLSELRRIDLRSHMLGDGLVFASIFLWAVFTVYGKSLGRDLGPLELIGTTTVISALWMLPVGCWEMAERGFSLFQVTVECWIAIIFLGVGCGFLATWLYFVALARTESQKVGAYLYTIPPMTYFAAAVILHEQVGINLVAGSLLVALGVFLTER